MGTGVKISAACVTILILMAVIPFGFEIHRRIRKGKEILAHDEEAAPQETPEDRQL
jgi:hypothetical protein